MAYKFKVAVCWSGQTRSHDYELVIYDTVMNGRVIKSNTVYNSDSTADFFAINNSTEKTNMFKVIDDLHHYGMEVDHYGHTWTDCELPINKDKFKSLIHEDQIVIDEWVSEDPDNRAVRDNNAGARGCYGQTWSALRAYELVEGDYDAVIKIRWDVLCYSTKELANWVRHLIYDQGESYRDRTLEESLNRAVEYYRTPITWESKDFGNALPVLHNDTICDIFWISNNSAFELWRRMDFKKKLHEVVSNCHNLEWCAVHTPKRIPGATPHSHRLWSMMQPAEINCIAYLPENFCEFKRTD